MRVLTGITTTGTPHLGNYAGAIRPSVEASRQEGVESFFFLADFHALIKCDDPARIERSRLQIAASWLAAGLDTSRAIFYRQSDIPEITELNWLLTCVTGKGLMNRAHAYKAASDSNEKAHQDIDDGINMGLFCYPVLMAADILMFKANKVPVGRDQIQHIEMARDIAARFNHLFGAGKELLVSPEAVIDDDVSTLPGLDGRKMSKSYDNTILLFEGGAKALKANVARIVTDSRLPGEPKDPDNSHLVTLFDAFATSDERSQFRDDLRAGMAWGDAKARFVAILEKTLAPMRESYDHYMTKPELVEDILQEGASRARKIAAPLLAEIREAAGLRRFSSLTGKSADAKAETESRPLPVFKQYRDEGKFYFKLNSSDGRLLLQSDAFEQGREAGQWIGRLRKEGVAALAQAPVSLADNVHQTEVEEALLALVG